jgi:AraC-like DNA-binding protein
MLVDCASSPFLGHWGLSQPTESIVGFQLIRKGVEQVRERSRRVALTAGDMILWDGLQPVDVEVVEPFVKRTLIFPRERVMAVCPRLADVKALPPLKQSGATRLLVRYVNALAQELPQLDGPASAAAASAALELLRAAVEPSLPSSRSARRSALQAEVRGYVRAHLQDPRLGPESIAHAHAMSVRALHALFEEAPESVAGLVRRERLERCLQDLERPTAGSITEIAFRWGFRDAAHFSRVFKREFDMTPSEARRRN